MAGHSVATLCLMVVAFLAFVACCFFNGIAGEFGVKLGIFLNGTGDVADYFYLEITPAGWTFGIWGVIYAWQVLFLGYSFSTICRRGPNGGYLYYDTKLIPTLVYLIYILNMGLNITWLLIWDRKYIIPSMVILALVAFTLYLMLVLTCRAVILKGHVLLKSGMKKEICLVWFLVHNAFGVYATWTTIATLLNFAMMLKYVDTINLDQSIASSIALGVLGVELILYSSLDFFVLDRYVRYLFTPYLVVPFALAGSLAKNWKTGNRNSILTACLIALAGLALLIKLFIMIYGFFKRPVFPERFPEPETEKEVKKVDLQEEEMRI